MSWNRTVTLDGRDFEADFNDRDVTRDLLETFQQAQDLAGKDGKLKVGIDSGLAVMDMLDRADDVVSRVIGPEAFQSLTGGKRRFDVAAWLRELTQVAGEVYDAEFSRFLP
ncbi:MAG: hypothetical protein Q8M66_04545 [Actinomycetota bacterium]|nr:hypothetical protein [Actinomycetota bacterium]MDZ4181157.1 hypothetical protein [Coriobacteriia bacterium]